MRHRQIIKTEEKEEEVEDEVEEHQQNEIFKLNSLESLFQRDCGRDKVKLKGENVYAFPLVSLHVHVVCYG